MRFLIRLVLALAFSVGAGCADAADTITWGTPTDISGDSDVVTTGTLFYAYNLGAAGVLSTTVNGVNFLAWDFPPDPNQSQLNTTTKDSVTVTETLGWLISSNSLGTAGGKFAALSSSYRNLLSTGGASDNAATLQMTLGGLTPGTDYLFQWWINNSSLVKAYDSGGDMLLTTASVGADSVDLSANIGPGIGYLGQYVTATFTANGTTKIINFNGMDGSNRPLINAFQLRVVPEPSTWILGGIATAILGLAARCGRRVMA